MFTASATCVAIALAVKSDTLRMVERPSRFGGSFVAIEDAIGVIEVADDMPQALARVVRIKERL